MSFVIFSLAWMVQVSVLGILFLLYQWEASDDTDTAADEENPINGKLLMTLPQTRTQSMGSYIPYNAAVHVILYHFLVTKPTKLPHLFSLLVCNFMVVL